MLIIIIKINIFLQNTLLNYYLVLKKKYGKGYYYIYKRKR
jgi:hypothetical protein